MQICNVHCVSKNMPDIITALQNADAATQSSNENSVCPSVRLSVKHVHCDKMEERSDGQTNRQNSYR